MKKELKVFLAIFLIAVFTFLAMASGFLNEEATYVENKGTLGDYDIEIISAERSETPDGEDAVSITYKWTNNSEANDCFEFCFFVEVFQSDIECTQYYSGNGKESANIRPGVTMELSIQYVLNDDSGDIDIEVSSYTGLFSSENVIVTKTFKMSELEGSEDSTTPSGSTESASESSTGSLKTPTGAAGAA